jgi:hypothetical protein
MFVVFLLFIGVGVVVLLAVRKYKVSKINVRKEDLLQENSVLIEQRLAYMELANLEVEEADDAYELVQSSLDTITSFDENSVHNKSLKTEMGSVNLKLESRFQLYGKIIEYDVRKDFYSSLAGENYDVLLEKVNNLREGIGTFEGIEELETEVEAVKESTSLLSSSLYQEDYNGLLSLVENVYRDYDVLKRSAMEELKEPLLSDKGIEMLTHLTNTVITNNNELKRLESLGTGSGFFNILDILGVE